MNILYSFPWTKLNAVHPELVEGWMARPFMLRRAQHERLHCRKCVFSIMDSLVTIIVYIFKSRPQLLVVLHIYFGTFVTSYMAVKSGENHL